MKINTDIPDKNGLGFFWIVGPLTSLNFHPEGELIAAVTETNRYWISKVTTDEELMSSLPGVDFSYCNKACMQSF